jgi:hypothetical protein
MTYAVYGKVPGSSNVTVEGGMLSVKELMA